MRAKNGRTKFHSGRHDRDHGASRRTRPERQIDWTEAAEKGDVRTAALQAERHQAFLDAINEETETGDESLDELHPGDAEEEA